MSKTYQVYFRKTDGESVTVAADSPEEAREKAWAELRRVLDTRTDWDGEWELAEMEERGEP